MAGIGGIPTTSGINSMVGNPGILSTVYGATAVGAPGAAAYSPVTPGISRAAPPGVSGTPTCTMLY